MATGDFITASEIVTIAVETLGLTTEARAEVGHGTRDDVRLDTQRMRSLGWNCARPTPEALRDSMLALLADTQLTRIR